MASQSVLVGKTTNDPPYLLLDDAFRAQVSERGSEPALHDCKGSTTFSQLDDKSTRLAVALKDAFNITEDNERPVILAMSPSSDRFIIILALWKLKTPYVPVESSVPKRRIKVIIRESKPAGIVFDSSLSSLILQTDMMAEGVPVMSFSTLEENAIKLQSPILPVSKSDPNRLACILYTSGSTGVPKGVKLTHRNIMVRLAWQWRQFPFKGNEVGMAKTSLLFVDSITESWSFLLQGRPVVIVRKDQVKNPEELVQTLQNFKVCRLLVVPSLLQSVLTYLTLVKDYDLSALEMVICSGESLPAHLAEKFFQVFAQDKVLVNLYGSTEITGDATCEVFSSSEDVIRKSVDGAMSIGSPLDNLKIRLVNDQSGTVAVGEVGEIWIQGGTVMTGYVNKDHEKGALVTLDDGVWYATGDYGRIVESAIIYEGRRDSQVKIRGNRVNLVEIEKCVMSLVGVEKVCVLVIEGNLVAFCATTTCDENEVREACTSGLPDYMVPNLFLVDKLPLSESTGKIDRVKLRELYLNRMKNSQKIDHTQKSDPVMEIIAQELGVETIREDDNFYCLGGNSVNIISVAAKLNEMGCQIDFQRFLKAQSVQDMMKCAVKNAQATLDESKFKIVPVDRNSPKEEILKLISESFAAKEVLTILCGATAAELAGMLGTLFYDAAVRSGASALMYREDALVAVVLNIYMEEMGPGFDQLVSSQPAKIQMVLEYLDYVEKALHDIKGKAMDMFLSAAKLGMSGSEALLCMHELEIFTMKKAKELGYDAVKSLNTSRVTQECSRIVGYQTAGKFLVKDYVREDGSRPFSHAADDIEVFASYIYL